MTTAGGTSPTSAADLFTFTAVAPTLTVATNPSSDGTAINPNVGGTGGGTVVTITGTNLASTTGVSFGTIAATSFSIVSNTVILATAPAQSAQIVDVTVTTTGGTTGISSIDKFTYVAAPVVAGLSLAGGSTAGGSAVTIFGSNFNSASTVSFGGIAVSASFLSSTQLQVVSPVHVAGLAAVTVANNGESFLTNSTGNQFIYVTPAAVTGVAAAAGSAFGSTAGGYLVTIQGSNFMSTGIAPGSPGYFSASAVSFGGTPATSFTVQSPTQISATVPALSAQTVDVQVTTLAGITPAVSADQFTYVAPPTISSLTSSGPTTGGSVVIGGSNLGTVSTISFAGIQVQHFTFNSATQQITATAPAHGAGQVTVMVSNNGGNATSTYTYVVPAVVTGVSPSGGATSGGTSVTISGSNFVSVGGVFFGTAAARSYNVVSATEITAVAPANTVGPVDVTVALSGVPSATSAADQFTYALIDTWTGAGGDNSWNTALNWSADVVPTSAYSVYIGSSATVNLPSAGAAASLTLSGGTITGAGALTVSGLLTWTGGSMSGTGSTTVGSLLMNAASTMTLAGWTLTNLGSASWQSGQLVESSGAQFLNQGTLATAGTGLSWSADTSASGIDNSGSFTIAAGYPIAASGNGTLSESGGTLTVDMPLSLANLSVSGGTLVSNAAVSVSGNLSFTGGAMSGVPVDVVHNFSTPAVITLGSLSYSAPTTSNDTLQTLEQQFDLGDPSGNGSYLYNARGAEEKYLISGNGSNSAGGGYYLLMPNGNLYAWAGSLSTTFAAAPVGSPGAAVYVNPALLSSPPLAYNAAVYTAEQTFDLTGPAFSQFAVRILRQRQQLQCDLRRRLYSRRQRQSLCLARQPGRVALADAHRARPGLLS